MNRIEVGQEGIDVETQWAEENLSTNPEPSLLLDGSGGATAGLGSSRRVEIRSEKDAPLGGAASKELHDFQSGPRPHLNSVKPHYLYTTNSVTIADYIP